MENLKEKKEREPNILSQRDKEYALALKIEALKFATSFSKTGDDLILTATLIEQYLKS